MACSLFVYFYSFSDAISSALKWFILGADIALLITFFIYDYRIKKVGNRD